MVTAYNKMRDRVASLEQYNMVRQANDFINDLEGTIDRIDYFLLEQNVLGWEESEKVDNYGQ